MLLNFKELKSKYNMNISGIIHIGAHYGQEVSDYIENGISNIILFEPVKNTFKILCQRMENLNVDIKLHNIALGSSVKKTMMYISDNEGQSSSILQPVLHLSHHPDVYFPDTEEVNVDILDNYDCNNHNCICMDVQGYELEVLKGASKTLKNINYVYCEVNRDEVYENNAYIENIDEFLNYYNFKRVETCWDPGIWGDALYVKEKNCYKISNTCQIEDLNSIYQKYFGYPSQGFFIEVGAYDGESFSNTSCLADHGWKGIYIEPIEEFYSKCLERHKNNNVIVIQTSIGEEEQEEVDFYVHEAITTSNKNLVKMYSEIEWSQHCEFKNQKCKQVRLETILQNNNVKSKFDLLIIDVEGNEESVLNSFNLTYWEPEMIIIELVDNHHSFQKYSEYVQKNLNIRSKILELDYIEVYKDEMNTVFVKSELYNKNN